MRSRTVTNSSTCVGPGPLLDAHAHLADPLRRVSLPATSERACVHDDPDGPPRGLPRPARRRDAALPRQGTQPEAQGSSLGPARHGRAIRLRKRTKLLVNLAEAPAGRPQRCAWKSSFAAERRGRTSRCRIPKTKRPERGRQTGDAFILKVQARRQRAAVAPWYQASARGRRLYFCSALYGPAMSELWCFAAR